MNDQTQAAAAIKKNKSLQLESKKFSEEKNFKDIKSADNNNGGGGTPID